VHLHGICELTLETRQQARLERFYVDALGLRLLSREGDRTWLAIGERSRLGLWAPGEKEFGDEGGRHVHFALAVRRGALYRIAGRLRALGERVDGPHEHDGGDRSLYTEDPEGNVVELWDYFVDGDGASVGVDGLRDDSIAESTL
jgi:catechol-2,3-dioxygenase